MANSETGDGQAAGGGRSRSRSKTRPTVDPNAADKGADGDSTETLKKSVAELQTQFLQVQQQQQTQFLQVQQQLQAVTEALQRQAQTPAPPAPPATEGQTGDGEAGVTPAPDPNPSSKVTLAPRAASSADASFADTDEAASWCGSEAAGDDIDGILVAVGQPDPKRKHDTQCNGLSENWYELLKEGPSDQSIPLRCGNGLSQVIRPAGEALRVIERLLPATEEPEVQAELDRLASDLRKGIRAAYSPLAFIQIQRTKGVAAANAISQLATQSEAHYSALGGIPLAGKLANYVGKFQEDVAKKQFKDLSKSSDKSSGGGSSGGGKGNGKLLTQEEANAKSNQRADRLRHDMSSAADDACGKCGLDADTKKKFQEEFAKACKKFSKSGSGQPPRGRSTGPRSVSRNSKGGAAGRG